jgi:hypothetical protein
MILRRPRFRTFWFLSALLQLLLPGAASIADARLEADSIRGRPTSHIEEHSGANCARVHPEDCALCRVLSASGTPATPNAHVPGVVLRVAPRSDDIARIPRLVASAVRSRAPPQLV